MTTLRHVTAAALAAASLGAHAQGADPAADYPGRPIRIIVGFTPVMAPIANAVNLTKDGRLLALGVSSLQRDALVPDVPTIAEAGVPGYDSILWFGLLTSSKVPRPVIAKLNREAARALRDPDAKARWAPIGLDPRPTAPEEFDRLIADDTATFTRLARAGNIKAE